MCIQLQTQNIEEALGLTGIEVSNEQYFIRKCAIISSSRALESEVTFTSLFVWEHALRSDHAKIAWVGSIITVAVMAKRSFCKFINEQ